MSFLRELKRRNVIRIGIAYVLVAWLVIQVADVILNNISAPDWVFFVILLLLAIGLVFAVFFSWAFEMTPEGLKREHEVDREASITQVTGRKLNVLIISLLVLALAYFVFDKFVLAERREAALVQATTEAVGQQVASEQVETAADQSIAVLPFVNLSSDPEQEYFSDGISEELLNLLAQIPDLHVTSRSSAFAFKDKEISIPDVASQLGVAHVLEGSVRKSGTRVRITAQLIEAESDRHLWSDTYDRELEDIFAIQDEISAAIVDALVDAMALEAGSNLPINHSAGVNSEAYTTFLLARHQRNLRTTEGYLASKELFQKAVDQDPGFALAYAELAQTWLLEAYGFGDGSITVDKALAEAEPLIERALDLDSELADAWAVKGFWMRADNNESASIPLFEKAIELNPSHSLAVNWLSLALRQTLRFRDELEVLRMGHRLDPLSVAIAANLVRSLTRFGYYDEADKVLENLQKVNLGMLGSARAQALFMRGRYADAVEAALRGEEELSGSTWTYYVAGYVLAAMGEQTEAQRLDPWEGRLADFSVYMKENIRDPVSRLAQLREYNLEELTPEGRKSVMWAYVATGDLSTAESMAQQRLESISGESREIDSAVLVLAIIAFRQDEIEQALTRIQILEQLADTNLADGDNFSMNYITKAIAEYFRGDESSAYRYLAEAFNDKSPVPLESENLLAIFTAMGWDEIPQFNQLMEDWEDKNSNELHKLFDLACNKNGFTVWTPLPESCEKICARCTGSRCRINAHFSKKKKKKKKMVVINSGNPAKAGFFVYQVALFRWALYIDRLHSWIFRFLPLN